VSNPIPRHPHDPSGPVCPLCRCENVPIVDTTGQGTFAIGEHRCPFPIFPAGYANPMAKARCPMSGTPLTACCDGDHKEPACSDPQCWRGHPPSAERCRARWVGGLAPLIDAPPEGARCSQSAGHPGGHTYEGKP
jgi:hypothetical protein